MAEFREPLGEASPAHLKYAIRHEKGYGSLSSRLHVVGSLRADLDHQILRFIAAEK